jgi:hypothetical protein
MQLLIARFRNAATKANANGTFMVNARVQYTPEEKADIDKYGIGMQTVYSSKEYEQHAETMEKGGFFKGMVAGLKQPEALHITVYSLMRGHRIESADLDEIISAETQIKSACDGIKRYLACARAFNGKEETFEY